jgi:hypothetical protein
MTCAEFEILLCDYLDAASGRAGALRPEQASAVERHMAECAACAELARDAGAALSFVARAADVEPPPELLTRILFDLPLRQKADPSRAALRDRIHRFLGPVLAPRFAMGMALTVLSFAMMAQCAGVRVPQLRPADLKPSNVWAGLEDRVHRTWERTLKSYESIRFVYEMQSRVREWTEQQQLEDSQTAAQPDERRLPAGTTPANLNGQEKNQNSSQTR